MAQRRRRAERVVPSARRLINSLRDLGYETAEAVADLIDNSIVAGAHNVDVHIEFDGSDSWIRVSDDGRGMSGRRIKEAMRYGAAREYEDDDLGKFGLGLKTASMSQCRRLTVASRPSRTGARVEVRQLDLDYVEQTDDWSVLVLEGRERPSAAMAPLKAQRGTVVLWEDLDRILTYQDPSGGWARRYLMTLAEDIEQHLGMVFHRFMQGEVKRRKLRITVNGNNVEPWDPYARDEPATEELKSLEFEVNTPSGSGIVYLQPYILPPKASFSSDAAWRRMGKPNGWNRQQGFYIYRANRLIQAGGWSYMRTLDEHTKLARIGMLFQPDLDSAFEINVAKMRVSLPPELRDQIADFVGKAARSARVTYDAKPDQPGVKKKGKPGGKGGGSWVPGGAGGGKGGPSGPNGGGTVTETAAKVRRRALERAAGEVGEKAALKRIVNTLVAEAPEVARDLGW